MSKQCENCLGLEKMTGNSSSEDRFDNSEYPCPIGDYPSREQCPIWGRIKEAEQREWQLIHGVHDVNNELVVVSLLVQMALKDQRYPGIEPVLRKVHRKVLDTCAGMKDVMDLKKMEREQSSFQFEPIEVYPLIDKLVEDYSGVYSSHQFIQQVSPEIRDIYGDRMLLPRVFNNLLSNAVKYSPEGGEIRVCAGEEGASVHFSVTDEGIGIPLEEQELIFAKFGRARGSKRFNGLGVGLALAKQIIEGHQGQIWVSSPGEGRGTSFHFTLPIPQIQTEKKFRELAAVS